MIKTNANNKVQGIEDSGIIYFSGKAHSGKTTEMLREASLLRSQNKKVLFINFEETISGMQSIAKRKGFPTEGIVFWEERYYTPFEKFISKLETVLEEGEFEAVFIDGVFVLSKDKEVIITTLQKIYIRSKPIFNIYVSQQASRT